MATDAMPYPATPAPALAADPHDDAMLDVRDLARRTRLSASYWRGVIRRREIRVYRLGAAVRVAARDLDVWLAARAQPAAEEVR